MADNELDLMQWQIGKQTTFGTKVTPTVKLVGIKDGTITPNVDNAIIEEQRGTLTPGYTSVQNKVSGAAKVSGEAYAEVIGYMLDNLFGPATPSGAGPYVRVYTGPGAKPAVQPITLVRGSSEGAYCLTGAVLNELNLKSEKNKPLAFDGSFLGQSVEAHALAALTDPATLNMFHANQVAIKLDTWAGTMGTTALTCTSFSADLGLNFNKALKAGLGSAKPTGVSIKKLDGGGNQLKLGLEFESAQSKGWLDSAIGSTVFQAQVQMLYTISAGVSLKIEYAGFSSKAPEIFKDEDGIATMDFTLNPQYHATLGSWLKITLTNGQATLLG
jgi:hypothetical protein